MLSVTVKERRERRKISGKEREVFLFQKSTIAGMPSDGIGLELCRIDTRDVSNLLLEYANKMGRTTRLPDAKVNFKHVLCNVT